METHWALSISHCRTADILVGTTLCFLWVCGGVEGDAVLCMVGFLAASGSLLNADSVLSPLPLRTPKFASRSCLLSLGASHSPVTESTDLNTKDV